MGKPVRSDGPKQWGGEEFPDAMDFEDLQLAVKEWRLTGFEFEWYGKRDPYMMAIWDGDRLMAEYTVSERGALRA